MVTKYRIISGTSIDCQRELNKIKNKYKIQVIEMVVDQFDLYILVALEKRSLKEELAKILQDYRSNWTKFIIKISTEGSDGTIIIPEQYVENWINLSKLPYDKLPDNEKDRIQKEVEEILKRLKP